MGFLCHPANTRGNASRGEEPGKPEEPSESASKRSRATKEEQQELLREFIEYERRTLRYPGREITPQ